MLKEKIKDGSYLEARKVDNVILLGKYLAYGISLGVVKEVSKRIQNLQLNSDMIELKIY